MNYSTLFLHARSLFQAGILVLFLYSCGSSTDNDEEKPPENTVRTLDFSGFEWIVRSSGEGREGPGPNYFSDSEDNVWVDDDGRLHLKIVQKGGHWYCAGISLRRSLGYGKYVFYVSGRIDRLDPNAVAGMFTYRNDNEEIDIEFSRWSDPDNMDSQFAVQPSDIPGNKERYNLGLSGETSTHSFDWQPDSIDFISLYGHDTAVSENNVIHSWNYKGSNIPPDKDERLKLNLWLFRGQNPSDLKEQEIIIEKVEYIK
ncbi:glycoside hydrolase family 16 protein [Sinomicrobium soli]|uniref:glycoside hydrolase family 16 protein n=1 Tax=Sinomicrobium sp. N-1-3-6 TaxID=2219864 RepID=UPI000DCF6082|nr:glycoside hydrolase family 16 protein [Sinomicrobium sp. N-1-3-6]RAV31058.1 hypothetical protein DN748_00990 [Sinomicrobium sp. N-1-3-6]